MADKSQAEPAWVQPFLAALAETRTATRALKAAGIANNTAYKRRKNNLLFAAAWETALRGERPAPGEAEGPQPLLHRNAGSPKIFFETLAETSSVTAAAIVSNLPLTTVYRRRRTDPEFRAQWTAALLEGYEHLEIETLHRLRMGIDPHGKKFDIANALRLLALHKETVARERALRDDEDEDAILASLDAKIDAMRAREAEAQRLLAREEADEPAALA